jgi:hypothetical protein
MRASERRQVGDLSQLIMHLVYGCIAPAFAPEIRIPRVVISGLAVIAFELAT